MVPSPVLPSRRGGVPTSYSIQDCLGHPFSKHLLEPITYKFPCNRNAHRFFQPRVGVFPDTDSKRLLEQVSRRFLFTENYYTIFLPNRIVCTFAKASNMVFRHIFPIARSGILKVVGLYIKSVYNMVSP